MLTVDFVKNVIGNLFLLDCIFIVLIFLALTFTNRPGKPHPTGSRISYGFGTRVRCEPTNVDLLVEKIAECLFNIFCIGLCINTVVMFGALIILIVLHF